MSIETLTSSLLKNSKSIKRLLEWREDGSWAKGKTNEKGPGKSKKKHK